MTYLNNYNTLSQLYSNLYEEGDTVLLYNYDDITYVSPKVGQVVLVCSDVSELVKFIESGLWEIEDTAEYTSYSTTLFKDGKIISLSGINEVRQSVQLGELSKEEAEELLKMNEKAEHRVLGKFHGFLLKRTL